jgi:hypothetical protein
MESESYGSEGLQAHGIGPGTSRSAAATQRRAASGDPTEPVSHSQGERESEAWLTAAVDRKLGKVDDAGDASDAVAGGRCHGRRQQAGEGDHADHRDGRAGCGDAAGAGRMNVTAPLHYP